MKIYKSSISWLKIMIFFLSFTSQSVLNGQTDLNDIETTRDAKISEEKFILINGIDLKGEFYILPFKAHTKHSRQASYLLA